VGHSLTQEVLTECRLATSQKRMVKLGKIADHTVTDVDYVGTQKISAWLCDEIQ